MVLDWKRRSLPIFAVAASVALAFIPVRAFATPIESTVSATVTRGVSSSVTVSPSTVAYGIVNLGATLVTPAPGTFTVTNGRPVPVDLLIRGTDTSGWTLSSSAGADSYVHRASSDGFSFQTIVLTTTNQTLEMGISAATGTSTVSLNMDLPTSSTVIDEQTASITFVATSVP